MLATHKNTSNRREEKITTLRTRTKKHIILSPCLSMVHLHVPVPKTQASAQLSRMPTVCILQPSGRNVRSLYTIDHHHHHVEQHRPQKRARSQFFAWCKWSASDRALATPSWVREEIDTSGRNRAPARARAIRPSQRHSRNRLPSTNQPSDRPTDTTNSTSAGLAQNIGSTGSTWARNLSLWLGCVRIGLRRDRTNTNRGPEL